MNDPHAHAANGGHGGRTSPPSRGQTSHGHDRGHGHGATAGGSGAGHVKANTAQEAKGQDLQAVDYYQKGIEIAHNASSYEDHLRAIENFSIAIAIRTNQPRFYLARGNAFRSINEYESAAKDYSMAIVLDERSAIYYANRGACYRKLNRPVDALEDLTAAIEMDVKKGNHHFNRALVLYEAGFYKEAIVDFSKALEEGTSGIRIEYRALQNRGNCYRRLGNLAKCIDDLQHAIKLDTRNPTGFSFLAQAYFEGGDYDNAILHYTNAIQINDTNASYYSNRGTCFYKKGDKFARQCLLDFNKCIKLDGKDPQAYFYRGSVRLALSLDLLKIDPDPAGTGGPGQPPNAVPDKISTSSTATAAASSASVGGNRANTPAPGTAATAGSAMDHTGLVAGAGLSAEDQLDAAYADMEMAWTLCPSGTKYQIGMAMITQLRKHHEEARTIFTDVHTVERTSVVVKYHLALSMHLLERHDEALTLLTDAIDELANEPLLYEARALVLLDLGLYPLAIDDFTRAIDLNAPDAATGAMDLYLRSVCFLQMEQFEEAVAGCTAAMALAQDQRVLDMGGVRNTRAMAYRGLGQHDDAIRDLSECIKLQPYNDVFLFHRGLCLMETRMYTHALPDLHAAERKNPTDARLLYFIGLCCYHEDMPEQCLEYLNSALANKPSPAILSDLYYHIGLSYALRLDHTPAIDYFTLALQHVDASDQLDHAYAKLSYVHERAKALQLEHCYEDALRDFSFVLQHNPHNANAYFRRAFAYKAVGAFAKAAADFETARKLDPNNPKLVINYKELKDIECVILCPPGQEKRF